MAPDSRAAASPNALLARGPVARSNRLALTLGAIAISLTCLIGFLAFQRGRSAIARSYMDSATREAHWYATVLEATALDGIRPEVLHYLQRNFQRKSGRSAQASLAVYDPQGIVRLDSRHAELVGQDRSRAPLNTSGEHAPATLGELMGRGEDWAGFYESGQDDKAYVAAFGFVHPGGDLVGLFTPADLVTLELDRASIPWLLGMVLVALVLMPMALLLLNRNYARSIAWLEGTQESLRESQARLSTAIESLPCEFWIHGRDGRVLLQNAQGVRSVGLMEGRTLEEGGVEPAIARFWAANRARALAGETFEIDYEREHEHGPRLYHAIVGPVRSEQEILGVSVLTLDLTDRRLTERALAQANLEQAQMNARLSVLHDIGREILQSSSVDDVLQFAIDRLSESLGCLRASILLVDRDAAGNEVRMRLAAAGGAALERQPRGSTFAMDCFSAAETATFVRGDPVVHGDLAGLVDTHPEFAQLHSSGVRALAMVPMINHGKLIGTLNLGYPTAGSPPREDLDIGREAAFLLAVAIEQQHLHETLRQHAFELEQRVRERTQKLMETNVEMETYVHTVTHDLRAPLRTIQGFGLALVEDHLTELGPAAREYVERMIAGAERMDLLMRELLAYSRLGGSEPHLQGVDLGLIEREAEALIASELEQSSAEVIVDGPLGAVRGHTPTLVQAVANLLSNAAKFVPAGRKPQIRLRPEPRGSRLRLWIEDNGIGIPADSRERIWGVFERLHGVDSYPGSGLGLAIVRRALERMHGTCGVESEPGSGSRFWIELDLAEAQDPAAGAAG